MKGIVVGVSLSGKTTALKHLRSQDNTLPIEEMDALLAQENRGVFPTDIQHKKELAARIVENIINRDAVIFFTNTDYFTLNDLKVAKEKGFKIIQLMLGIEELQKRNKYRMENEGYEDLSKWFAGMLRYQKEVKDAGLVDEELNANFPVAELALKLEDLIK